jgi:hypothetical protein
MYRVNPALRAFQLFLFCGNITDNSVFKLAECCLNTKDFRLMCNRNITDISITRIAECCCNIEVLDIKICPNIAIVSIQKFREDCMFVGMFVA